MFVTLAQINACVVQGFVGFAVSMFVIENLNVNHFLVEALRLRGGPLRRDVSSSAVFFVGSVEPFFASACVLRQHGLSSSQRPGMPQVWQTGYR